MQLKIKLIITLLSLQLISSCGFQLRGQIENTVDYNQQGAAIYFSISGEQRNLKKKIALSLNIAKFKLHEQVEQSDYQLLVIDSTKSQKVIGLDQFGRNNEFEITVKVEYLLLSSQQFEENQTDTEKSIDKDSGDDNEIMHFSVRQSLYIDSRDVIGKRAEQNMIIEGLEQQIARHLVSELVLFISNQANKNH